MSRTVFSRDALELGVEVLSEVSFVEGLEQNGPEAAEVVVAGGLCQGLSFMEEAVCSQDEASEVFTPFEGDVFELDVFWTELFEKVERATVAVPVCKRFVFEAFFVVLKEFFLRSFKVGDVFFLKV